MDGGNRLNALDHRLTRDSCEVQPSGSGGRFLQKTGFCAEVVALSRVERCGLRVECRASGEMLDPGSSIGTGLSALDSGLLRWLGTPTLTVAPQQWYYGGRPL